MKKLVFTIAALAAFSVTNAQTELQPANNQTPKKSSATVDKKEGVSTKKGATTENGAVTTTETSTTTTAQPKKAATRMAINEKGLPGEKKPANSNTKSTTNTNSNPK